MKIHRFTRHGLSGFVSVLLGSMLVISLAGCGAQATPTSEPPQPPAPTEAPVQPAPATEAPAPTRAYAPGYAPIEIMKLNMNPKSVSPNGIPVSEWGDIHELEITPDEAATLKAGNFTAALAMHYFASDWSQLQIRGIQETLVKYGVRLLATTDGELKVEKQVSDVENLIQLKPDVLIWIPVDSAGTANVAQQVLDAGIKMSIFDVLPSGLEWPDDYISMVATDNYGVGYTSGKMIAEAMGGEGQVYVTRYGYRVLPSEQRNDGALDAFAEYPGIEVVAYQDFFTIEEATALCENALTKYPDLKGFWAHWEIPTGNCVRVAESQGRFIYTASPDMSLDSAIMVAENPMFVGHAPQVPYHQGSASAMLALYALLGKPAEKPFYGAAPLYTTADNVVTSYEYVFQLPAPEELIQAAATGGKAK